MRALALFLAGAAPAAAQIDASPEAVILSYGIYCSEGGTFVPDPRSSAGFVVEGRTVEHRATTLTVPARLGLTFGFEFELPGGLPPGGALRTQHPPFEEGGSTANTYPIAAELLPGHRDDWWYTFDLPFEQVTGEWVLRIDGPDGEPIVSATFEVVPDGPAFDALGECGEALVS